MAFYTIRDKSIRLRVVTHSVWFTVRFFWFLLIDNEIRRGEHAKLLRIRIYIRITFVSRSAAFYTVVIRDKLTSILVCETVKAAVESVDWSRKFSQSPLTRFKFIDRYVPSTLFRSQMTGKIHVRERTFSSHKTQLNPIPINTFLFSQNISKGNNRICVAHPSVV